MALAVNTENQEFSGLLGSTPSLERLILSSRPTSIAAAGISIYCPAKPISNYVYLLSKELQQKKSYISPRQPVYDLRLKGYPLRQFGMEELTELVFRLGSHFKIASQTCPRSISLEPDNCSSDILALVRGLGFTQIQISLNATGKSSAVCYDKLAQAFGNVEGFRGFRISGQLLLDQHSDKDIESLVGLFVEHDCTDLAVSWLDGAAFRAANHKASLIHFNTLCQFMASKNYLLVGDSTFKRRDHPDVRLLGEDRLRYGPWGFYSSKISEWLGLGIGADGMISGHLYHNTPETAAYVTRVKHGDSPVTAWSRRPMSEETEFEFIQQLYCDHEVERELFSHREDILSRFLKNRWLAENGRCLRLTDEGIVNLPTICKMYGASFKALNVDGGLP